MNMLPNQKSVSTPIHPTPLRLSNAGYKITLTPLFKIKNNYNLVLTIITFITMTTLAAFTSNKQGKIIMTVSVEVKDYAVWKQGFEAGEAVREKAGIKVISISTAVGNENQVLVIEEAENIAVANDFLNLLKSRQAAGDMAKLEVKLFDKIA